MEAEKEILLNNNASLDRSSKSIRNALVIATQTEAIGANIMENLESQRKTIIHIRAKTKQVDKNLSKSRKILNRMFREATKHKVISMLIIFILIAIIVIILILKLS